MPHTSAMLFVVATGLAGFDEILTLQSGASQMGRPFHLVDLSTLEEERSNNPVSTMHELVLSKGVFHSPCTWPALRLMKQSSSNPRSSAASLRKLPSA